MRINKDLCDGCGKCVAECHKTAIISDNAGKYNIDAGLCNDCDDMFDIECIRFCAVKAITADDGAIPKFDTTLRVRSEHLLWIMSLIGSKGNDVYRSSHWNAFRKIVSDAYLDPDLKVRLTKSLDDTCAGCLAKQKPGHIEESRKKDDVCFERLGVEPGTVMKFWDAVQLIEDKFSIPFIKEHDLIGGNFLDCFLAFISRDAKLLINNL